MSRTPWVSDYSRPCYCGRMECEDIARLWHAVRPQTYFIVLILAAFGAWCLFR